MNLTIWQALATKNPCYVKNAAGAYKNPAPAGIIVHSTGANNPNLKRYVNDPEHCGTNIWRNYWDNASVQVCVHAFIGKDKNGNVGCAQLLPWNYSAWGVGGGLRGSYNFMPRYIQFEICEDALKDEAYFLAAFDKAAELCAHLCQTYSLSTSSVIGHAEAYRAGYGSNHADPEHWLFRFGKNMAWFRKLVDSKIEATLVKSADAITEIYRVGTSWTKGRCVGQIGAYRSLANAANACPDDYEVYNSVGEVMYSRKLKKGSIVKVLNPIVYGTDKKFTMYYSQYTLFADPVGDRAVIAYNGTIVAAISTSNLKLI